MKIPFTKKIIKKQRKNKKKNQSGGGKITGKNLRNAIYSILDVNKNINNNNKTFEFIPASKTKYIK